MHRILIRLAIVLLVGGFILPAHQARAQGARDDLLVSDNYAGFLEAHPDLLHYRLGLEAFEKGDTEEAMRHFRIAAKFADKPSQALIAEMYWSGLGVLQDRALAYAWMDLAAERGYRRLLVARERYWNALSPLEQERAIDLGSSIYDEFGDEVAQRRIEAVLRRERRQVTGSRTGYAGNTDVMALVPGTPSPADAGIAPPTLTMAASQFFDPKYWEPALYYQWREQQWEREFPAGKTDVGPLEPIREASRKPAPEPEPQRSKE